MGRAFAEERAASQVFGQVAPAVSLAAGPGRELIHLVVFEDFGEMQRRQGVDLVVGRQRQEASQAAEVEFVDDGLRERIGSLCREVVFFGLLDILGIGIDQQDLETQVSQRHRRPLRPEVGAQEKHALRIGIGQAQVPRQRRDRQAVDGHRPHDHQKHDGHDTIDGAAVDVFEPEGKQPIALKRFGRQQARHRPGQKTENQQQQDRRHADAPRQPLRPDAQHDDTHDADEDLLGQAQTSWVTLNSAI